MDRREFLTYVSGTAVSAALSRVVRTFAQEPVSNGWRTFEVTTSVEVLKPSGSTRVWLPAALLGETPFQKTLANEFKAEGAKARLVEGKADALGIVVAEFPGGAKPSVALTSRVATRNYAVNLSKPSRAVKENRAALEYFLRPTKQMPTDGIVKTTADKITAGSKTDVEKARAIYEWIVVNTFRNPKTRGRGVGDIRYMLETKDLGGKCADLNALYVGLARAAGLPARDFYGMRVAQSDLGYESLGPSTPNITKAQHCRAEVYLHEYGWVPVDPRRRSQSCSGRATWESSAR